MLACENSRLTLGRFRPPKRVDVSRLFSLATIISPEVQVQVQVRVLLVALTILYWKSLNGWNVYIFIKGHVSVYSFSSTFILSSTSVKYPLDPSHKWIQLSSYIFFFERERAVSRECCNLIGYWSAPYFPISDHGHGILMLFHFASKNAEVCRKWPINPTKIGELPRYTNYYQWV